MTVEKGSEMRVEEPEGCFETFARLFFGVMAILAVLVVLVIG